MSCVFVHLTYSLFFLLLFDRVEKIHSIYWTGWMRFSNFKVWTGIRWVYCVLSFFLKKKIMLKHTERHTKNDGQQVFLSSGWARLGIFLDSRARALELSSRQNRCAVEIGDFSTDKEMRSIDLQIDSMTRIDADTWTWLNLETNHLLFTAPFFCTWTSM